MAVQIRRDGAVAVVTVDRPEALNALDTATKELLLAAVRELSGDEAVRVVILTGAGDKAFVAGADISEMKDMTPEEARQSAALGQAVMSSIEAAPQPWIAAVNGYALGGGCELALACDLRIAADTAKFGQPEIGLGITPGFGGTQRLVRADVALRIGLVQAVVPRDELAARAKALADELASRSPLAMRYCKAAVQAAGNVDLETGQAIERDLFALCFATEDQKEAMAAFLEKRPPEIKGR
jgi:enoyl-CoA hydratase